MAQRDDRDRDRSRPKSPAGGSGSSAPRAPLTPLAPSRRPAFNPGLLASPFYAAATSYGGAGAIAAAARESRQAKLSPAPQPRAHRPPATVAVKPSGSSNALGRTAQRIWDLLAHYSSPISDAKRAPARLASAASASTSSATPPRPPQPLRVPSIATLIALKRNNRRVDGAQAAIAASLSSTSPLPGDRPHSNKMRSKLTGRNRERDALAQYDLPSPVELPGAALDVSRSGLPAFAAPPRPDRPAPVRSKLKRPRSPRPNGPVLPDPVSPGACRAPAKRFLFSDPLDGTDPDTDPFKSEPSAFAESKLRPVEPPSVVDKKSNALSDSLHSLDTPAHLWNGTSVADFASENKPKKADKSPIKKAVQPKIMEPTVPVGLPSLESFIKKQQSQWECDGCLTRNSNDKDKCVCCETPKPGTANKTSAPPKIEPAPPVTSPKQSSQPLSTSGFASFLQKQQAQWECPCCLTRNDTNRVKCVCCEATKPGAEVESAKSNTFNFGSNQTSFKFGIDKLDTAATLPNDKLSESNSKNKDLSISSSGFTFGIPPSTKIPSGIAEISKTSDFKFGIPNGSTPVSLDKEKTDLPISNTIFGNLKETAPPVTSGFSFGFNNQKDKESPVAKPSSEVSKLFDHTSPQQKSDSNVEPRKEVISSTVELIKTTKEDPAVNSTIVTSTSSLLTNNKDTKPLFTFGTPSTTPTFGISAPSASSSFGTPPPKFNFGSPTSTTTTSATESIPFKSPGITTESTPFKPPGIFSFGAKANSPNNSTPDLTKPISNPIPKPQFSLPVSNTPVLFSTTSSTTSTIQPKLSDTTPLADTKKLTANSPFSSPNPSLLDKPKELSSSAPVFNFVGSSTPPAPNAVPNIFKPITTSAAPIFSFGGSTTKSDQPNVPIFGSLPSNSSTNLFGNPVNNENKTPSTDFKPVVTSTSTFAPITGSIFGSTASNPAPQNASTNLFGNAQTQDNKSTNIFASSLNSGNTSQNSVFNQSAAPTFNFGSSPSNNVAAPQATNFFGSQPSNKLPAAPDSTVNSFLTKTQSAPANIFSASATPALSSGGMFGSHPAVPTPVFGASIPFGDASQTPAAQNVPFKFGESNSIQSPMAGFGQVPAAGSSAPVFSFGSSSAAAPVNSQFNFSMGAPTPAFPTTPGTNPNMSQRRYKKAVRRNVPR